MKLLAAAKASAPAPSNVPAGPFSLVVLYLCAEFGRPQEFVPAIGSLHIPALLTMLLALALLATKRLCFSETPTWLFAVLLCLMVLHVPIALNNYWALRMAHAMLGTFIAYLAVIGYASSLGRFATLITVWLGVHAYLAIIGITRGGRGVAGFMGDENDLAMTMNVALPFAFFLALASRQRVRRFAYYALVLLFSAASIATHSRGGFLALVGTALFCWLRSPAKAVSAALIGLAALGIAQFAPQSYWEEIQSIRRGAAYGTTGEERIYQWKIGWRMFLDNPIMGVGQENFAFEFRRYEIASGFDEGLRGRSRAGRAAHSLYFTLLPELGVLGAALWMSIVYCFFRDMRRTRHLIQSAGGMPRSGGPSELEKAFHLTRAVEASAVAYLIGGIFLSVLYYPTFWILLALAVALRRAVASTVEDGSLVIRLPSERSPARSGMRAEAGNRTRP